MTDCGSWASSLSSLGAKRRATVSRGAQFVTFRLGAEEYGIDIARVREIIRIQSVTHLPDLPPFIEGVINLRGHVIPIIDLRKRFGLVTGTGALSTDAHEH
ncbi:MAG: chemotaxis protein CheW, partial [Bacteroidota bacterium]